MRGSSAATLASSSAISASPRALRRSRTGQRRWRGTSGAGRSIAIYGDYDVDGITATAILFHIIRRVAPDTRITTYVPHRLDEGYGINADALCQLQEQGAEVVISVDCGITAYEPLAAAADAGLDVIVVDHHVAVAGRRRPRSARYGGIQTVVGRVRRAGSVARQAKHPAAVQG